MPCKIIKCKLCGAEYCERCDGICPNCYISSHNMQIVGQFIIKEIEKLKPKKDMFGLSKTNQAKIIAYNKVIKLIEKL